MGYSYTVGHLQTGYLVGGGFVETIRRPAAVVVFCVLFITLCIALRIRLKAYVLDTLYEKRFATDVTLRVLEVFAEHGIKPPSLMHQQVTAT